MGPVLQRSLLPAEKTCKMKQQKLRRLTDLLMVVLMPVLMAYSLVGEELHEWLGIAAFLLFLFHHVLNRAWFSGLTRGVWPPARIVTTAVNLLLLAVMFLLPLSGLAMSRYILPLQLGWTATARTVHLLASYWGYLLMGLHLGFHVKGMSAVPGKTRLAAPLRILWGLAMLYGAYAFWKRAFPRYLFLRTAFAFFDFNASRALFFLDYIAILALFAGIGYFLSTVLPRLQHTPKNH